MPSIRLPENIAKLAKASSTTVILPASRTNVGGQQYLNAAPITLSTQTIGAGGVDASVQPNSLYYVYAVVSAGSVALIASLSSSAPSGFTNSRLIGNFYTDMTSSITRALFLGELDSEIYNRALTPPSNLVINGAFSYWQRGTSFSHAGNAMVKTADRFSAWVGATMASTISQQPTSAVTVPGYAYRFQKNSGVATNTNVQLVHHIEGKFLQQYLGKYVTLSFRAQAGANFSGVSYATNGGVTGSTVGQMTINLAFGTGTSDVNLVTSGFTSPTWLTQNVTLTQTMTGYSATFLVPTTATQFALEFCFQTTGTAGANDYVQLEQVQLTQGEAVPSQYSLAGGDLAGELAKCQRYFEIGSSRSTGDATNTNVQSWHLGYKVNKRAVHTVTTPSTFGEINGGPAYTPGGTSNSGIPDYGGIITSYNASGGANSGYIYNISWTADAEL